MNALKQLLPNAWYIAAREYRSRIASRSFFIGTVILAAVAFAAAEAPVIIDSLVSSSQTKLVVVATAKGLPGDSEAVLVAGLELASSSNPAAKPAYVVTWQAGGDVEAARAAVKSKTYDAVLVVDRAADGNLTFALGTDMARDGGVVRIIHYAAQQLSIEDRLVRGGQPEGAVAQVVPWGVDPITDKNQTSTISQDISSNLLSTGLIVLIFMAIITYGTWVAMSVAEEKGSRVMELMLNAATPLQMLAGKVIGNGAAGITQYAAVLGAAAVGVLSQHRLHEVLTGTTGDNVVFASLTPAMIGGFALLFILGFTFYALLYAGLGSLVSRQEDVQSATSPLLMLTMSGYFISVFALNAINEPWVRVLSFVPFFSPYLMLGRIAMGEVAPWEVAAAAAILLVSIGIALVIAARIYSAGVLLYGQRVGLREIFKAARVSR